MKQKFILFMLVLFIAVPAGTAFALPEEQVIDLKVSTGYYDIWKHSDDTWQVTGRPGGFHQVLAEAAFRADRLRELGEDWTITRIEANGEFGRDEYEAAGGWWGSDWERYFSLYYQYRPKTQFTVPKLVENFVEAPVVEANGKTAEAPLKDVLRQAILTYFEGETIPVWIIELWNKYELGERAIDLTDPDIRQKYGLPPKTFSSDVEGWRVFLPALITWYGVPKAEPDFSVSLDKHEIEADPGDPVEVVATYKLNESHTQNEKAILKAFHEVNGTQYPVTLKPVDPANRLDNHVIEFPPGESKQYIGKVTAQDASSKIIVKVWPAEAADDADWSNNSDEAVIQVEPPCTDVSVNLTVEKFNNKIYGGDEFFMNATIKRGYDGPVGPADVRNSLNGPGIMDKKSGTLPLKQGQSVTVSWLCQVNNSGTYSYQATVEPVGVVDCAPGNNTSSFTINVYEDINNIPEPDKIEGWLTD